MYSQASASVRTFFSKTDSSETFASFDLSLISYFLFLLIFQNSGIQPEAPVQGLERAQPNISTTAGTQPSAWPHRGDKWCPQYSREPRSGRPLGLHAATARVDNETAACEEHRGSRAGGERPCPQADCQQLQPCLLQSHLSGAAGGRIPAERRGAAVSSTSFLGAEETLEALACCSGTQGQVQPQAIILALQQRHNSHPGLRKLADPSTCLPPTWSTQQHQDLSSPRRSQMFSKH